MRNLLYYEDNTLQCNARDVQTKTFTSFNNCTIDLQSGKYMISIDITATVTEAFYDAIDKSNEVFTDSPFSISIIINDSVSSFTIGQYTPISIHMTRCLNLTDSISKITINSDYTELQNIDISVTTERV